MIEKIIHKKDLENIKKTYNDKLKQYKFQVLICNGAACNSSQSTEILNAARQYLSANNLEDKVMVTETGCMGMCAQGPLMLILPQRTFYTQLSAEKVKQVLESHIVNGKVLEEYTFYDKTLNKYIPKIDDIDFFKKQVKITLETAALWNTAI